MSDLIQLVSQFNISTIIVFVVLLGLSAKGIITFFDWIKEQLMRAFNKESKKRREENQLQQQDQAIKDMRNDINKIQSSVRLLLESDKDDIKAWITEKHHYYCYQQKYIDDYTLDCLEKRYNHYEVEGGNSFVHTLMDELRALPKKPQ